jgi:outer membrane protein OmpA-like peptidoglycan-associated protein
MVWFEWYNLFHLVVGPPLLALGVSMVWWWQRRWQLPDAPEDTPLVEDARARQVMLGLLSGGLAVLLFAGAFAVLERTWPGDVLASVRCEPIRSELRSLEAGQAYVRVTAVVDAYLPRRLTATCRRDLLERKFQALLALADKAQGQEKIRHLQQARATAEAIPHPDLRQNAEALLKEAKQQELVEKVHAVLAQAEQTQGQKKLERLKQALDLAVAMQNSALQHTAEAQLKAAAEEDRRKTLVARFDALRAQAEKTQGQEKIRLLEQTRATAQGIPSPALEHTAEALIKAEQERVKAEQERVKAEQEREALAQEVREKKQLMAALAELGATITQSPDGSMTILLPNAVLFASGKAEPSGAALAILDKVAGLMHLPSLRSRRWRIAGHTDNKGKPQDNVRLSEDRAQGIVRILLERGVETARLEARGYGASQPIADNRDDAGRARNRRVEIILLPEEKSNGKM